MLCFVTQLKIYCIAQGDKSFICCIDLYFRTSWFYFAYAMCIAYATTYEKPLLLLEKFCIQFKIALLTHKCVHAGYAPINLEILTDSCSVLADLDLARVSVTIINSFKM